MQGQYANWRVLLGLGLTGAVLGLAGPFGSYDDFPMPLGILYWVVIALLTYGVGNGVALFVAKLIEGRAPLALCLLAGGAVAGLPVTLTVIAVNALFYGARDTMEPLMLLGYCTAISMAVAVASLLFDPPAAKADPAQDQDARPAILERLPPDKRGPLLSLSVSDHYVEVATERGRCLVLMRLSDAIRETAPTRGLQIHRSHWVARDAIVRAVRRDGKPMLELSSGAVLPVSRSFAGAARDAGLL